MRPISTRVWISLTCLVVLMAVVAWGSPIENPEASPWSETGKDAAKVLTPTAALAVLLGRFMAKQAERFFKKYDADRANDEAQFRGLHLAVGAINVTLEGINVKLRAQDERAKEHDQMDRDNHEQVQREIREIRERLYR